MDDFEIMRAIAQGDREAFHALVEKYKDRIFQLCYKFVRNHEDAEDLTQDIFIQVYKKADKFEYKSTVFTWLYRITMNKSVNYLRRKEWSKLFKRIEFDIKENAQDMIPASKDDNPDSLIQVSQKKTIIQKALNSLPKNQRVAFHLHNVEELPYAKIADIMECSISAVESRIHRAKLNLQKHLTKYLKEIL